MIHGIDPRSFRAAIPYLPLSLIVYSYRSLHEPRFDRRSTNELLFIDHRRSVSISRYRRIL